MHSAKNILVVDDSDITRQSLKDILGGTDLNVITCNDGLEGIKKAIEHKPEIILLDIHMPNFDGIKMLQVIKLMDDLVNVPVIVISANTNRANVLAATEAGADKIIAKPINNQVLIDSIKEFLGPDIFTQKHENSILDFEEESDLRIKLKNYFIENFGLKGRGIVQALAKQDSSELKSIVHNIRGTGGAIGYPKLTALCAEIEDALNARIINWWDVREKCDNIFVIVDEMKVEQEGIS